MKLFHVYSIALIIAGLSAGCITTYSGSVVTFPERSTFEKIPNAKLELKMVGVRELLSGIDDSIQFKLTNVGTSAIRIEEWYMKDADNLRVFYQDWRPGTEEPNPKNWEEIKRIILERPKRYPLDLAPGMAAFVRVGLPFMVDLKVTPGKERRFFIKAELNLTSVNAKTEVFAVSVL